MGKRIDLAGKTFGLWTVIHFHARKGGKTCWWCRCACGTERAVNGAELRYGKSTNCGCVRREKVATRNFKHGLSDTRLHIAWMGMIARCEYKKNKRYHRYGGRGITICERWRNSFAAFLEDMGEPPTPKHTIDRIDNDGNYEPGNCRWATNKENCQNRSQFTHVRAEAHSVPSRQQQDASAS